MESIAVAAMAIPYKPASEYEIRIATTTDRTGQTVDFIDIAIPAIILVASPVSEAAATFLTGPYSVAV
jgi:hypothetical protein